MYVHTYLHRYIHTLKTFYYIKICRAAYDFSEPHIRSHPFTCAPISPLIMNANFMCIIFYWKLIASD